METLEDLKAEIAEAAGSDQLPPAERAALLQGIRDELASTLEDVDAKIAEATADPDEPAPYTMTMAVARLRARADAVQEQVDAGLLTEQDVAEAAVLTNGDLDQLAEEGLLEATAQELIERARARLVEAGTDPDTVDDLDLFGDA